MKLSDEFEESIRTAAERYSRGDKRKQYDFENGAYWGIREVVENRLRDRLTGQPAGQD